MEAAEQTPDSPEMPSPQNSDANEDDQPTEISKDELFHVLQNERRRRVLTYILHNDGPFEMRSIAEQVAAWEHDTTVRQLMSDERQRVYIALYQSHLPKLDNVGLIEYEQNRGVVEATPLLETVSQYVDPPEEIVDDDDQSAPEPDTTDPAGAPETEPTTDASIQGEHVYLGVAAFSLLLTGGVWLGSIPAITGLHAAVAVTGLFLAATAGLELTGRTTA